MSDLAYLEQGHARAEEPRRDVGDTVGKRARTDALRPRRAEAAKVAAEHIAHGIRDENKLTNEVFWWLEPALRDVKLAAGTDAAVAWLHVRDDVVRPALAGDEGGDHAREVTGGELTNQAQTAALGGGKWDWKRASKGLARSHLASGKLKALLDRLDSGKRRDVSVHAAKEDGVDPRKIDH